MSSAKKNIGGHKNGNLSSKNMLGGGSNGSNVPLPFAKNERGSSGNPSNIVSA